mmetsp:Transcript_7438/g.11316  ORF Transcript_7438/g.11316 Transcript_7438/m.11316 type:complete len:1413 (-) Transcript_7438:54-4292(-)
MERPPTPLRKVESTSTNSLSSLDPNNSTSIDPQSRRLVEYFVVFSSKPRLKNKKKKKADEEEEDGFEDHDGSTHNLDGEGRPKTPKRYCCKKKRVKRSGRKDKKKNNNSNSSSNNNSGGGDGDGSGKKSNRKSNQDTVESKRISSRAIHLSENNVVDSHNSSIDDPISADVLVVEDITPLTKQRKSMNSPLPPKGNSNSHNRDRPHSRSLSQETLQSAAAAAAVGMANNDSFRVPVTNGSFTVDNNSDSSPNDTDDEGDGSTTIPKSSKSKLPLSVPHDADEGDDEEEGEVLTPSRMRAKQGMYSDDEQEEEENNGGKEKYHSNSNTAVKKPGTAMSRGTEGGASENIHLPEMGQKGGEDQSSSPNVYLVPVETARYPPQDHVDNPFNPMISHFCFPQGQQIQFTTQYVMPRIHYFVLTNDRGKKMYGCCLTVYEEFDVDNSDEIDEEDLEPFFRNDDVVVESADSEDSIEVSLENSDKCPPLYHPKVLCILSSWPYLNAFREYLSQLYRLATMTNMMSCPIERYVLNICEEVPAPPPGMFEIRLQILNSTIRFWAPPAKQPIPYVSIPFNVLFECLDLNNVLFVWYALTLEHKVLLVSSQNSLLTLCAEILLSLLFPMEWSHLYIPILPLFLSQMLDAPFPYLCGISRDNLTHAIGDISEETIVVDLDQNLITKGDNTPSFPPMPLKRRSKLESCLQKNVGEIFWAARGVTKEEVQGFEEKGPYSSTRSASEMMKTIRIWKERLISYDDAFNLAFTPDSENLMNAGKSYGTEDELGQTKWDCVQEGFLTFFVSMLRDYKRFMSKVGQRRAFREKEFISAQRPDFRPFLKAFCLTQHFDCFITKRMYHPKEPDVLFFDQSITAKRNRSIKTLKKKRTPFLQSAKAQKQLRTVHAAMPSLESESNFNLLDRIYLSSTEKKVFSYSTWPDSFDANLLKNPRKIPDVIAAEFDRRSGQRPNQPDIEFDDFHVTEIINSVEVTAFTLFFAICCELVGKELEGIQKQYTPQSERVLRENGNSKSVFSDCNSVCTLGKSVSSITVNEEYTASYKNDAMDDMKGDMGLAGFPVVDELKNSEIEAARLFAFAELDLAFSVLETLFIRKLRPNADALKPLMAACGRCGCKQRTAKLMKIIQDRNIDIDSDTYFYFHMIAPLDDIDLSQWRRKLPSSGNWSSMKMKKKTLKRKKGDKKKKGDDSSLEGSDHSYFSGPSSSFQDTMSLSSSTVGYSQLPPRPQTPMKRKKPLRKKEDLNTTDQVDRHINIGESLISYLYKDLQIDTNSATCRSCGETVSEDQVRSGWKCSFTDYTTECPYCRNSFVPSFVVKTSDPAFIGSQGSGTPLHCEFLSPWVLHKEIHVATQGGTGRISDPKWRNGGDINATLWWNLVVTFQRHKLPITFLLQGSFRERLIMPMPDSS